MGNEDVTVDTNSYGGFLSIDDDVCLYQDSRGSVPDDIPAYFED